jgi:hypothetical protein
MKPKNLLPLGAILCALFTNDAAFAQGTAFTYQGRLNSGGAPANGSYDLRFIVYDNSAGGSQQGPIITNAATAVSNGLFTVTLDFGNVFPGAARFMEIAVRTNGNGAFTTLSPRQPLTPAPYAITAGSVVTGGLSAGAYGNAVTFNNSANQFTGTFTGNGANLTNVNAATLGGQASANFWQLGGNTVSGGQFFGSVNNQPVEIRANNLRAMQLAYASNAVSGYSPNVIGGNSANNVATGVVGATIAGGGGFLGFSGSNFVTADFGTVVGGSGNSAKGTYAIAGGNFSTATGQYSTAMGNNSSASGIGSTAMGFSVANGLYSTAMGLSDATADYSTAMGHLSIASGYASTAMGASTASGTNSTAFGNSQATNSYATAMGNAIAGGQYSTAMGGSIASGNASTAMGVSSASGADSTAMGASIASGYASTAMGYSSASGDYSFAAGELAQAANPGAFVFADFQPVTFASTAPNQFLIRAAGGVGIGTPSPQSALHIADPSGITIGQNFSSGGYTALQINLSAVNNGYAVLQAIQSSGSSYGNLILNQYGANVGIATGANTPGHLLVVGSSGSPAYCDGTTWVNGSDRNSKENFTALDAKKVLAKVVTLPLTEWNYKTDPADRRHIGPMAQDFHDAFSLNGDDDKHIATVDEGGVALAAIQGLNQKLEEARAENAELKARLDKLEQLLNSKLNGGER